MMILEVGPWILRPHILPDGSHLLSLCASVMYSVNYKLLCMKALQCWKCMCTFPQSTPLCVSHLALCYRAPLISSPLGCWTALCPIRTCQPLIFIGCVMVQNLNIYQGRWAACSRYRLLGDAEEGGERRKFERTVNVRMNCLLCREIKNVTSKKLFRVYFPAAVCPGHFWICISDGPVQKKLVQCNKEVFHSKTAASDCWNLTRENQSAERKQ